MIGWVLISMLACGEVEIDPRSAMGSTIAELEALEAIQFVVPEHLEVMGEEEGEALGTAAAASEEPAAAPERRPKRGQAPFVSVPVAGDTPGVRTKVVLSAAEKVAEAERRGQEAKLTDLERLELMDYEITPADRANPRAALERLQRRY